MRGWNVLTPSDHGPALINRNDRAVGLSISMFGHWERELLELLTTLIRKAYPRGSSLDIVDGGANIGIYTLALSRIEGLNTRIFAVEAQRLVYQMLNANLALNSIANVWTYHRVLSDVEGETLALRPPDPAHPANFGAYEVREPLTGSDFDGTKWLPTESVGTLSIDSLPLEDCALLKLDLEGMEDRALRGAIRTLERCRPLVMFERHKTDYAAMRALLLAHGYSLWGLPDNNVLAAGREWDGLVQSVTAPQAFSSPASAS